MDRRLAAILFSDIVGYTAMMGENESKTLELVGQSREIQKPLVEKHGGVWLKEMGDGAMAQFKSALDAVKCAIEIQQAASNSLDAQLRIGIHLGDITIKNDEIYGDGINIASRIESIAEPGSIYISEAVRGAIKGSDIFSSFRGEKKLKNVEQLVRVYKIGATPESTTKVAFKIPLVIVGLLLVVAYGIWKLSSPIDPQEDKTIAVLPFRMTPPDSTYAYLIQGINEELVRSIGKVRALTVVSPISTMRFMASLAPVQEASNSLSNTDYFLSGNFGVEQNRLNLDLSLHNREQQEIWSRTYDGDVYELPKLTGTIAVELAEVVDIRLEESETSRIVDIPPVDPESFRLMLLGKSHLAKFNPEDIAIGLNYLRQAVDNNPTSSQAWSNLAQGLTILGHGPAPPTGVWDEARAAATRALQLDSLNAEAWAWLGTTKTYYHWDYRGAEFCYNKANSLNPSLPMSHYHYSWHLLLFDSLDKAVEEHEVAFKLDPLDPFQAARLGHIYILAGEMGKALEELRRSQQLQPGFPIADLVFGDYYMQTQQYDSAALCLERTDLYGKSRLAAAYLAQGMQDKAWDLIREMEENITPYYAFGLAILYAHLGNKEKFFEYANYPKPHAFHPWLRVAVSNPDILSDARFKDLMVKMNLPMPLDFDSEKIMLWDSNKE